VTAVLERLTLEQFREKYADEKPYWEFWGGEAIQKPLPTRLHAKLQLLIANMLQELGYSSYTELTLRIDPGWEPTPDVVASLSPLREDYPTKPVDVVVEILSPEDRFVKVIGKCQRYASVDIPEILVLDPVEQCAWAWRPETEDLVRVVGEYRFRSREDVVLTMPNVWLRFNKECATE